MYQCRWKGCPELRTHIYVEDRQIWLALLAVKHLGIYRYGPLCNPGSSRVNKSNGKIDSRQFAFGETLLSVEIRCLIKGSLGVFYSDNYAPPTILCFLRKLASLIIIHFIFALFLYSLPVPYLNAKRTCVKCLSEPQSLPCFSTLTLDDIQSRRKEKTTLHSKSW